MIPLPAPLTFLHNETPMARPLSIIRKRDLHVRLSAPLYEHLNTYLYSDLEGRVPLGKVSDLVESLLRRFFEERKDVS